MHQLGGLPRAGEGEGLRPCEHGVGHQPDGVVGAAAAGEPVVAQRAGVPQDEILSSARGPVAVDHGHVAGQAACRPARRGWRSWRWRPETPAASRNVRKSARAAAARRPRSRPGCRDRCESRRRRRSAGCRRTGSTWDDTAGSRRAACRGSTAPTATRPECAAAGPWACRHRKRPRESARGSAGCRRATRAVPCADPGPGPWWETGTRPGRRDRGARFPGSAGCSERLAAGGACDDDQVVKLAGQLERRYLMRVEPLDAPGCQQLDQRRRQRTRRLGVVPVTRQRVLGRIRFARRNPRPTEPIPRTRQRPCQGSLMPMTVYMRIVYRPPAVGNISCRLARSQRRRRFRPAAAIGPTHRRRWLRPKPCQNGQMSGASATVITPTRMSSGTPILT